MTLAGCGKNQAQLPLVNADFFTPRIFPDPPTSFGCQGFVLPHLLTLFSITPAINSGVTGGTKP
jgi:hypothetical protein